MLDRKEIDLEIAKWEYLESSYPNYSKLAYLYIIRDHMGEENVKQDPVAYDASYSSSPADTDEIDGDSEFLEAVRRIRQEDAWSIMDDLMDTLHVANPRVYNGVMRKIRAL